MSVAVFDCMHVWAPRTSVRAWRLSACQKCGIVATAHWLRHQSTEVYDKVSACGSYVRETLPSRLTYWDRYWSLLDAYGSTRRLLEVGAGYGFFAAEAAQRGWQVTALEPSSSTIEDSPFSGTTSVL